MFRRLGSISSDEESAAGEKEHRRLPTTPSFCKADRGPGFGPGRGPFEDSPQMGFWSWLNNRLGITADRPAANAEGGANRTSPRTAGVNDSGPSSPGSPRLDRKELLRRLGVSEKDISALLQRPCFRYHKIPKRGGGERLLHSPIPELKRIQRLVLRRLLRKLAVHPAAKGFRRGESVVTHARLHVGRPLIVRMDVRDFFPSTRVDRINLYFQRIGWTADASWLLLNLCTRRKQGLPQGAPTSPVLSNLVNYGMDARLTGLAKRSGAVYSRYADDLIFSFDRDDRRFARGVVRRVRRILGEHGYRMHGAPKLQFLRRHQRQLVTGLVVNEKVQLPRAVRRWLRAVEHHHRTGLPSTLTAEQLTGWQAYQRMIEKQR